jgi:hypothetical protein
MLRAFKITVVVLALILKFLFLALFCNPYPHGEAFDVSFRHRERVLAFADYVQHRSPETKATWEQELRLMHDHEDWKMYLALGLLVAINGAWVYFFWRYEHRKAVA